MLQAMFIKMSISIQSLIFICHSRQKKFLMGLRESDFTWTNILAPLTENKAAPLYDFNWFSEKYVKIGNAYWRSTKETITEPAGTFKMLCILKKNSMIYRPVFPFDGRQPPDSKGKETGG
ncbi:hypothetical protein [Planococcus shixiaomingii]|uniref:hypothetical protein n=1 Tax=Planococcus shixiaomingii TaxID=3058393 RepID=UPI002614974B|nr:hypothetical protein [Planococcus sp. N022]WKA53988.1 hypothetical protein QWY21_15145 [Planococcus sp. N022]